jgi:hypothetical protein
MGAIIVQEQPEVNMTTEAAEQALDQKITTPDNCICDYATVLPYHLLQRVINPACTVEHGVELERERDK